jgi:hypothetical protein
MSDLNGDLLRADEKIEQGNKWQDTMNLPVAGEQMEFGFTLLDERVRQRVQDELPLDEFREYRDDEESEEYERFMELQRKDDLTEEEEDELVELAEEVDPEEEGQDSLGEDAVEVLMDAGKEALEPTEDDVNDLISAEPPTQQKVFEALEEYDGIPQHLDADVAKDALREYMKERIEDQPFPIKFYLGQRSFMETMSVMGNGFQNTSTSDDTTQSSTPT